MTKRIIYFILGILILALGLTLNTKSLLGVSAINSLPNALSLVFSFTLGNFVTMMYCVFIVIQLILLKKLDLKVIGQLPFSFAFGYLVDLYRIVIPAQSIMTMKILFLALGIIFTALGATLMVKADLVLNPADGIVNTISKVSGKPFGICKNAFDIIMVLSTVIACLLIGGRILDTIGIGTVLSALLIGRCIALIQKYMKNM